MVITTLSLRSTISGVMYCHYSGIPTVNMRLEQAVLLVHCVISLEVITALTANVQYIRRARSLLQNQVSIDLGAGIPPLECLGNVKDSSSLQKLVGSSFLKLLERHVIYGNLC